MTDEWYEIAWINFTKAILHGQICDEKPVEQVLTDEQREEVYALNERHERETRALLRSIAGATA